MDGHTKICKTSKRFTQSQIKKYKNTFPNVCNKEYQQCKCVGNHHRKTYPQKRSPFARSQHSVSPQMRIVRIYTKRTSRISVVGPLENGPSRRSSAITPPCARTRSVFFIHVLSVMPVLLPYFEFRIHTVIPHYTLFKIISKIIMLLRVRLIIISRYVWR